MPDTKAILYLALCIALGLGLACAWLRSFQRARRAEAERPRQLFAGLLPLLSGATITAGPTAGVTTLVGHYRGHKVQFKAVADNLAARKLPSLWLMASLLEPQPISHVLDIMMRPSGPTTFSNFDFLPYTLPPLAGLAEQAVLRSDQPTMSVPPGPILKLAPVLASRTGKELLISPKGLRLVVQLAEASRARYGVFRQADFGNPVVSAALAQNLCEALIELASDLAALSFPQDKA